MKGNIQIHIELEGVEPKIWRRIVVPSIISLDRLHDVLQIVMGWSDTHQHEFVIANQRFTDLLESEGNGKCQEEGLFRLGSLLDKKGMEFTYLYDFGDEWSHRIKIEKTGLEDDEEWGNLYCLEGWGNCPPEDVGGVPGFEEFCEALSNKKHPEHETMKAWYGDDFERDIFDCDEVNLGLLFFLRWSKDRSLPWYE